MRGMWGIVGGILCAAGIAAAALEVTSTVAVAGRPRDVRLSNGLAFSADQYGLLVVNAVIPQPPGIMGHWGSVGLSSGLEIHGDYAYLCDGLQGLHVLSVANPWQPQYMGFVAEVTTAVAAHLNGQYLYVACGDEGLAVLDLADPANPVKVGDFQAGGWVQTAASLGNLAVVAVENGPLCLLDCSQPESPAQVGQIPLSGAVQSLILAPGRLYVLHFESGLSLWDVANPAQPFQICSFPTGGWSTDMALQESIVAVADYLEGITLYDLSDPLRPVRVTHLDPDGFPEALDWQGDLLAAAVGDQGLEMWDIANPYNPLYFTSDIPQGSPQDAVWDPQGRIYEAAGDGGLRVWDEALSAADPEVQVQTPGWANSIAFSQQWIYLADGFGGLRIFTRSSSPQLSFVLDSPHYTGRLAVHDQGVVYAAQGDAGFLTVALEGFGAPQQYGLTPASGYVCDLAVSGNLLLVCQGTGGFTIFDVTNPTDPVPLSLVMPQGGAWSVCLSGSMAYVSSGIQGLKAWDLSSPLSPQMTGQVTGLGWVEGLSLDTAGNLVACSGMDGVYLLAVEPALQVLDHFDSPGLARRACSAGDGLILADDMALSRLGASTGVVPSPHAVPSYSSLRAHPNPFNPSTTIGYRLPAPGYVNFRVYDTAGREVATLVNGWRDAGTHEVTFDASGLASGVYLVRLEAGDFTQAQKLILLK